MTARIYKPAKSAMQSGEGRTREWILEFEPRASRGIDPLMGWTSSSDTSTQLRLAFDTREEAESYARRRGLAYVVSEPKERRPLRKSYADNFKYGRLKAWTH